MTSRESHWQSLAEAGLMDPPPDGAPTAPWYIRVMQGFAAWVASIFVFAAVLALTGFEGEAVPMGITGVVALGAAWLILRGTRADFLYQASLALSLAGQLFITLAFEPWKHTLEAAIGIAVIAVVLVVVMEDFVHRLIAALVFSGAVIIAALDARAVDVSVPVLAVPFALAWASEPRWRARRPMLEPAALGLGFGLLASALLTFGHGVFNASLDNGLGAAFRVVIVIAALGYVMRGALEDAGVSGARRSAAFAIALAATLALELAVTNAATATLVLVAAVRAQRAILSVAAVATLVVLVSHRYYTLELTLLVKSIWLMGAGALLLLLYAAARRWFGAARDGARAEGPRLDAGLLATAASVVLCVSLVGWYVARSESVLANGRVMVLELAPVDPRSIIQGDFMRLRFAVERTMRDRLSDVEQQRGWVVLQADENGIARFESFADARPEVAADAFAIPYRWRGRRLTMLTDAFFFQEGTADVYDDARYGAFRVSDGGAVILQSLLDEAQQPLGSQY